MIAGSAVPQVRGGTHVEPTGADRDPLRRPAVRDRPGLPPSWGPGSRGCALGPSGPLPGPVGPLDRGPAPAVEALPGHGPARRTLVPMRRGPAAVGAVYVH